MSRRTLSIALFVSLAFNLFLVGAVTGGFVVGHRIRGGGDERPSSAGRGPPQLWRAGDALPPDQARAERLALRDQGRAAREEMHAVRAARLEAWRALGQEPFDAKAAKARLAAIRAEEADARGQIEDSVVDFAVQLSPADRAGLARGLTAHRGGPPGERGEQRER